MILKLMKNEMASQLANDHSEGIGRLPEALSATVTEERNGSFTLKFTLPMTAKHYPDIQKDSVIVAKPNPTDPEQMFRVYKSTKPLNGIVTYYCNHISYDLVKTTVLPFTATTAATACAGIMQNMLPAHLGFTLTTDKATIADFKNTIPQSARALMGGQEGSLIDTYGGELKFDNLNAYLLSSRGIDSGVSIRYGKNLTDINQEENIESVYNVVLPYAKMTADDQNAIVGDLIYLDPGAAEPRILNLDLSDKVEQTDTITAAMLDEKARAYIAVNNPLIPKINIKVSFVNLADTEEYKNIAVLETVKLCDTVTVIFEKLGVNGKAKVIKTVFDVLNEKFESIEIGDPSAGLSKTVTGIMNTVRAQSSQQKKYTEGAVDKATALITGGLGGYVVMKLNSDGKPEEILIMDTPDRTTATNVIRMNLAGIGFSTNGYEGPYTTAWTIDGSFVADFITTGTLNAGVVDVVNIDADNITTGTIDAETINVEHLNASNLTRGTMDNARAGGQTENDITVVNWDGQLCHFEWENGIGADYWLEPSTYWKQIYEDAGGDYQRG